MTSSPNPSPNPSHPVTGDEFDAAFLTIRPLDIGVPGQTNFWTASVPGWGVSAPTVRQLVSMLRGWFALAEKG